MEHTATWNTDRPGGTAKGFCCLNASVRDFGKLGKALNDALQGDSFASISPGWANRMSDSVTTLDHGWGYAAFTWHPNSYSNLYLGLHGQYVYMDPAADVVILKLSNSLSEADNPDVTKVFEQIVLSLQN